MNRVANWDQCDAFLRCVDEESGRERVLVCNLKKHCDVQDTTEEHYDEGLGALWKFADDYDEY